MLNEPNSPEHATNWVDGKHAPSVTLARATAATAASRAIIVKAFHGTAQMPEGEPKKGALWVASETAFRQARSYVRKLDLSAPQLYRLVNAAHVIAAESRRHGQPIPDDRPIPEHNCTHGQWRNAAWLITRAAYSVLIENYRATDLGGFLDLAVMAAHLHQFIPTTRERRRFRERMKEQMNYALAGLPVSQAMRNPKVQKPKGDKARGGAKAKVPARMLPAYRTATASGAVART